MGYIVLCIKKICDENNNKKKFEFNKKYIFGFSKNVSMRRIRFF